MVVSAGGPATVALRSEHEMIRRTLDLLERAGRRLVAGRSVRDSALVDLVHLLRQLADRCHHAKEEQHLSPAMRAKGLPPIDEQRAELAAHGESRDYLGTLAGLPSPAERAAAALLYVRVMREHLDAEERDVFPVADVLLTPVEQAAIARACVDMERAEFGVGFGDGVRRDLDRLEALIPA